MKRRHFIAELSKDGRPIAMDERFAWNAAIRASEALVRTYAERSGESFTGGPPEVYGRPGDGTYRRRWTGDLTGQVVRVDMQEVFS